MVAIIVILVAGAALVAGFYLQQRRRRELREQFGGEYDRIVDSKDSRRDAERELTARRKRHDQLDIRPLDPGRIAEYRDGWHAAQLRFVDEPAEALEEADTLVEAVMSELGYPVGDFDVQLADLSVEHADVLQHYRAAHAITTSVHVGDAETEAMRRAMVHYRTLFADLLDEGDEQRPDDASDGDQARPTRRSAR